MSKPRLTFHCTPLFLLKLKIQLRSEVWSIFTKKWLGAKNCSNFGKVGRSQEIFR